jgi:hypothetical protein
MIIHSPIISGSLTFADGATFTLPDNGIYSGSFSGSIQVSEVQGDLIPSAHNTYDLGSTTNYWRDLFLSSGSLYINGIQVLSTSGTDFLVQTDAGENFKIQETGADTITLETANGDITLTATGTGNIELDAPIQIGAGNQIISSDGNAIQFGEDISVAGFVSASARISSDNIGNVDGTSLLSGSIKVNEVRSDLIPDSSASYDLGSESFPFRDLYISSGTAFIGGIGIGASIGGINFKKKSDNSPADIGAKTITLGGPIGGVGSKKFKLNDNNKVTLEDENGDVDTIEVKEIVLKDTSGNGKNTVVKNDNGRFTTSEVDDDGTVTSVDSEGALSGSFTGSIQDAEFNGDATFNDNATFSGTVDATGLASLDGGIDVGGAFTVATTSGNVSTSGTLGVTGDTTLQAVDIQGTFEIGGTAVTSTATEINKLDGITVDATKLNYLSDMTGNVKNYVDTEVAGIVNSAPAALDTLNELATALGNDANFATTTSTALGNRLRLDVDNQSLSAGQITNALANLGVTSTSTEINLLDGSTAGAVINSKAVVYGSAGEVNATKLQVGGVDITSTPAELNILDGVTATTAELNILDGVTSTAAELNILDGVTSTATELNILSGVTATTAELNILDGVTSTATELNILDGVTATTAELNILDGVTSTATELNYVSGVTSAIQTQLDSKIGLTSISATDDGGDGSFSYDNTTGVFTYTGPSAAEVRAHFSGGTGVTITDGSIAIGQSVGTGDSVTFSTVSATGDIIAYASSDERLKDNIEVISNPIEKVQQLKGVTWDWNDNADELQKSLPNVGVIAQDVEKVLPQLVKDRDNGFKGVDYDKIVGLLIEAIKDQQSQIDELKAQIK